MPACARPSGTALVLRKVRKARLPSVRCAESLVRPLTRNFVFLARTSIFIARCFTGSHNYLKVHPAHALSPFNALSLEHISIRFQSKTDHARIPVVQTGIRGRIHAAPCTIPPSSATRPRKYEDKRANCDPPLSSPHPVSWYPSIPPSLPFLSFFSLFLPPLPFLTSLPHFPRYPPHPHFRPSLSSLPSLPSANSIHRNTRQYGTIWYHIRCSGYETMRVLECATMRKRQCEGNNAGQ